MAPALLRDMCASIKAVLDCDGDSPRQLLSNAEQALGLPEPVHFNPGEMLSRAAAICLILAIKQVFRCGATLASRIIEEAEWGNIASPAGSPLERAQNICTALGMSSDDFVAEWVQEQQSGGGGGGGGGGGSSAGASGGGSSAGASGGGSSGGGSSGGSSSSGGGAAGSRPASVAASAAAPAARKKGGKRPAAEAPRPADGTPRQPAKAAKKASKPGAGAAAVEPAATKLELPARLPAGVHPASMWSEVVPRGTIPEEHEKLYWAFSGDVRTALVAKLQESAKREMRFREELWLATCPRRVRDVPEYAPRLEEALRLAVATVGSHPLRTKPATERQLQAAHRASPFPLPAPPPPTQPPPPRTAASLAQRPAPPPLLCLTPSFPPLATDSPGGRELEDGCTGVEEPRSAPGGASCWPDRRLRRGGHGGG